MREVRTSDAPSRMSMQRNNEAAACSRRCTLGARFSRRGTCGSGGRGRRQRWRSGCIVLRSGSGGRISAARRGGGGSRGRVSTCRVRCTESQPRAIAEARANSASASRTAEASGATDSATDRVCCFVSLAVHALLPVQTACKITETGVCREQATPNASDFCCHSIGW